MSASKIKVLILGQTGMLGHMVKRVLEESKDLSVFGTQMNSRTASGYFDALEGIGRLERIFKKQGGFDYCVNCIGLTAGKVDKFGRSPLRKARLINSVFPGQLAGLAGRYGCKVIHISTDGVFRGTNAVYYEDSRADCSDIYGKSKLAGEIISDNFLSIRCSIIGPSPYEGSGLWEWFAGLAPGSRVCGFANHVWNGVTTLQFGRLCREIILRDRFNLLRDRSAVYHFAPNRPISKFALLNVVKELLKKDVNITRSVRGKGKISRILRSRFKGLDGLVPRGLTMRQAINQLLVYERKKNA